MKAPSTAIIKLKGLKSGETEIVGSLSVHVENNLSLIIARNQEPLVQPVSNFTKLLDKLGLVQGKSFTLREIQLKANEYGLALTVDGDEKITAFLSITPNGGNGIVVISTNATVDTNKAIEDLISISLDGGETFEVLSSIDTAVDNSTSSGISVTVPTLAPSDLKSVVVKILDPTIFTGLEYLNESAFKEITIAKALNLEAIAYPTKFTS